ncbi:hypothetical protein K402DRAFT_463897 [Aulographum hederae CBS 113979]|uniref:Small ribosomal subunit protein uS3m n=1 Tax=Aulographum hederae CBS 113979 TaxID=1176131 RepID=A0A6G1GZ91_9PEZI|nr:hypothetical protein K402DRAFT_463897 [Aulographum hederae CBS 113979]
MAARALARGPIRPPLLSPSFKAPLEASLARLYKKPVTLNLIPISHPSQNADILAQVVATQLRTPRSAVLRVIRNAIRYTKLAPPRRSEMNQPKRDPIPGARQTAQSIQDAVMGRLRYRGVSSVRVEVRGRLTKRMTANRAVKKVAMKGRGNKGAAYMLRNSVKSNVASSLGTGKRRTGAYGVRIEVGHE